MLSVRSGNLTDRGFVSIGRAGAVTADSGRLVGMKAGFVPGPGTGPFLVDVHVAPEFHDLRPRPAKGSACGLS